MERVLRGSTQNADKSGTEVQAPSAFAPPSAAGIAPVRVRCRVNVHPHRRSVNTLPWRFVARWITCRLRWRLSRLQLPLLGELFQLLQQPPHRLLVLLPEFPPDRVVGLAVLLVLLIGGNPLQLRGDGRDQVVDLVVDQRRL